MTYNHSQYDASYKQGLTTVFSCRQYISRAGSATVPQTRLPVLSSYRWKGVMYICIEHVIGRESRVARYSRPFRLELAFVLFSKGTGNAYVIPIALGNCPPQLRASRPRRMKISQVCYWHEEQVSPRKNCIHHELLLCHSILGPVLFRPLPIQCRGRSAIGRYGTIIRFHPRPSTWELRQLQIRPPDRVS